MLEDEDNISLEEVISICNKIKKDRLEIREDNIGNLKTKEFLWKYGFNESRVYDEIRNLKIEDYHAGPVEDKNPHNKHSLWIFLKYIEGIPVQIYIKIKIINHKTKIIVYSFHEEGLYDEKK